MFPTSTLNRAMQTRLEDRALKSTKSVTLDRCAPGRDRWRASHRKSNVSQLTAQERGSTLRSREQGDQPRGAGQAPVILHMEGSVP